MTQDVLIAILGILATVGWGVALIQIARAPAPSLFMLREFVARLIRVEERPEIIGRAVIALTDQMEQTHKLYSQREFELASLRTDRQALTMKNRILEEQTALLVKAFSELAEATFIARAQGAVKE